MDIESSKFNRSILLFFCGADIKSKDVEYAVVSVQGFLRVFHSLVPLRVHKFIYIYLLIFLRLIVSRFFLSLLQKTLSRATRLSWNHCKKERGECTPAAEAACYRPTYSFAYHPSLCYTG